MSRSSSSSSTSRLQTRPAWIEHHTWSLVSHYVISSLLLLVWRRGGPWTESTRSSEVEGEGDWIATFCPRDFVMVSILTGNNQIPHSAVVTHSNPSWLISVYGLLLMPMDGFSFIIHSSAAHQVVQIIC